MHEDEVAIAQGREPGPHRVLPALAARLDDHGLPGMQGFDLALRVLQPAGRADDHDPVDLVQGEEELEHPGQRRPAVEPDQRLAAAAEA